MCTVLLPPGVYPIAVKYIISFHIDDCLVCGAEWSFIPTCIPDSHLYRLINTKCRIGTVFSPDDGHTVARNTERKAINILRKCVHQVGAIYKRLYKAARSTNMKFQYA